MKKIIAIAFVLVATSNYAQTKNAQISYEAQLNSQYSNRETSPLTKKDLKVFKALPFFPFNKSYVVMASFKRTPDAPLFKMETTSSRTPLYQQYGIATFVVNGSKQELKIYQSQDSKYSFDYKDHLFLPFKDLTNGKSSYEGGRYIDVFISDITNNQILLDFNRAYNPYCAYNHNYSCPIPPVENHLNLAIEAGVKKGILKN